ncbi:MAG: DUF1822 family protein [Calothrix sp. SM1_7_51]|nr:DUF1822 family protein [Calothrix sp. SM1_7_51]
MRGKIIDLGVQLGSLSVALVIAITPDAEDKLEIFVSVHPVGSNKYLPSNLRLKLLSESSQILQDVESRSSDNYIQLKRFKGYSGERFSIVVAFDDYTITENFII